MLNKDRMKCIDNHFTELKENKRNVSAISGMAKDLNRLFGKKFNVAISTPNNDKQKCNIMSVFPSESTISMVIDAIVNEQPSSVIDKLWKQNVLWTIEIDGRILDSSYIEFSAEELTALLLHELGHVMYSSSIPHRIGIVMKFRYAQLESKNKYIMKNQLFKNILAFPIVNACVFNPNENNSKIEMNADSFAVKNGYGKELSSAIDKIIIRIGKSLENDNDNPNSEMEELMDFAIDTVLQLEKRQNNLVRENLKHLIAATPSNFIRSIIAGVMNIFSAGNANTSMTESAKDKFITNKINTLTDEFYASEFFFNRVHKLKRIDPADLDYIAIEAQNIKSNDDKMMLISYIYSKLDIINYYITLIESKNTKYSVPHSKESLEQMKDKLEKIRKYVINCKIPEIKYGINIGYPAGYEG